MIVRSIVFILAFGFVANFVKPKEWESVAANRVDEVIPGAFFRKSLGGLKVLAADYFWVKKEVHWEKKELNHTLRSMEMSIRLNPLNSQFWIQAGRTVAYDMAHWRLKKMYKEKGPIPDAVQRKAKKEQVEKAILMMDKASLLFPDNYKIPVEKAQYYLQSLQDNEKGLFYYQQAASFDDRPYIVDRIHAELLKKMGRSEEALAVYQEHFKRLPEDDPYALREVVWERIQELEKLVAGDGKKN